MNKLSDDILNNYIDGELDHASSQHVNGVLSSSVEDKKRFQALLAVHSELKKIKAEKVTDNFTSLVIKKLQSRNKALKEQRNFVFVISTIFIAIILFILGLVIYYGVSQTGESQITRNYTQYIITFFNSFVSVIVQLFSPKGISIFGSIISLGILISAYFFFENLKASNQKVHKS